MLKLDHEQNNLLFNIVAIGTFAMMVSFVIAILTMPFEFRKGVYPEIIAMRQDQTQALEELKASIRESSFKEPTKGKVRRKWIWKKIDKSQN